MSLNSTQCPCGSGLSYAQCCEPYHKKKAKPKTAEACLRARYCAFVKHEIDFILDSHHPKTRNELNRSDVETWSKGSSWLGLEIKESTGGGAQDEAGTIVFCARYRAQGKDQQHWENALFEKLDGSWMFVDAQESKQGTVRRVDPKVGRNDPCPCGSGKKYKKCHGHLLEGTGA